MNVKELKENQIISFKDGDSRKNGKFKRFAGSTHCYIESQGKEFKISNGLISSIPLYTEQQIAEINAKSNTEIAAQQKDNEVKAFDPIANKIKANKLKDLDYLSNSLADLAKIYQNIPDIFLALNGLKQFVEIYKENNIKVFENDKTKIIHYVYLNTAISIDKATGNNMELPVELLQNFFPIKETIVPDLEA